MVMNHQLSFLKSTIIRSIAVFSVILFSSGLVVWGSGGQKARKGAPSDPTTRIGFKEARELLVGIEEGNLGHQPNRFSRTRLHDGRILEIYYPLRTTTRTGKRRTISVAGYGLLYDSEAAFKDATRPRHMLEDLIPNGEEVISNIPQLVARLEKRLRLGRGRLDYTRSSLRRIDSFISRYQRSRTTAQTDPELFQELTAYYGETIRRSLNGQWRIHREPVGDTYVQPEPNISFSARGQHREIKPWSSVISALYDEDNRGVGLTKVFDADLEMSR